MTGTIAIPPSRHSQRDQRPPAHDHQSLGRLLLPNYPVPTKSLGFTLLMQCRADPARPTVRWLSATRYRGPSRCRSILKARLGNPLPLLPTSEETWISV